MMTATATRHPTLVDKLVDHVYSRIIQGELHAGQRITEDQLATEFGVSRTPVREAVKRLVEMGVVVSYPRARLEVATAEPEEIRQIAQLREDLECLALAYALPKLSESDVDSLESLAQHCQSLAQSGNRVGTFRADSKFHLALAALSGNRYLNEALRRLDVKVQLCRATLCLSKATIRTSARFHERIITAIRRRDVDGAQALMRQHIRGTLEHLKGEAK